MIVLNGWVFSLILCEKRGVWGSKEVTEEHGRIIGEADDFVGGLAIEFEIELGFGAAVVPLVEGFELGSTEGASGQGGAFDGDGDARGLAEEAGFLWDWCGGGDEGFCDESLAAFVFAGEDVDGVAAGDAFAAVHCFLRFEGEGSGFGVGDFGFDGECGGFHFVLLGEGSWDVNRSSRMLPYRTKQEHLNVTRWSRFSPSQSCNGTRPEPLVETQS